MTPTTLRVPADGSVVLIPSTPETAAAELESAASLARALGVEVDPSWPPELYDRPAVEWNLRLLQGDPEAAGWGTWYFGLRRAGLPVLLIGAGGYKGKPSDAGEVEIGYSIVPAHQRRGYGSAAAGGLVARALGDPRVKCVLAETLPELTGSIRVLEHAGFALQGAGSEAGVVRYILIRE